MNDFRIETDNQHVATMYCLECGGAMRVAPEHVQMVVACPHCGQEVEPWRHLGLRMPGGEAAPDRYRPPWFADPQLAEDGTPLSERRRVTAGLLGIFLGGWGAHRFYLGFTSIGILQIVVTLCTCGLAGLWGFIEGILCLTGQGLVRDVDGLPLRD